MFAVIGRQSGPQKEAKIQNPGALFQAIRDKQALADAHPPGLGFERNEMPMLPAPAPEPPRPDEEAESAPIPPPKLPQPPYAEAFNPLPIAPEPDSYDGIVIEKPEFKLPMSVTPWLAGQYKDPATQDFLAAQNRWWLAGGGVVLVVAVITAYVVSR